MTLIACRQTRCVIMSSHRSFFTPSTTAVWPSIARLAFRRVRRLPCRALPPLQTGLISGSATSCRVFAAEIGVHYRRRFNLLALHLGKRVCVERSGASLLYADRLVASFPAAKYVHLYRRGVETALSMSRHTFFRAQVLQSNRSSASDQDPDLSESQPNSALTRVSVDRWSRASGTDPGRTVWA